MNANIPVAICWDDIVDAQLLGDFFDAQMEGVGFELLARHVGQDGSGQSHEACGLVLRGITPSVSLLASSRPIGFASWLGVASALQVMVAIDKPIGAILFCKAALAKRDVVRSGDPLISPRHPAELFATKIDTLGVK
jgi:hypothetical protein